MTDAVCNLYDKKTATFTPVKLSDTGETPTAYGFAVAFKSLKGATDTVVNHWDAKTATFYGMLYVSNGDGSYSPAMRTN